MLPFLIKKGIPAAEGAGPGTAFVAQRAFLCVLPAREVWGCRHPGDLHTSDPHHLPSPACPLPADTRIFLPKRRGEA